MTPFPLSFVEHAIVNACQGNRVHNVLQPEQVILFQQIATAGAPEVLQFPG
jgi:hypothetical protein